MPQLRAGVQFHREPRRRAVECRAPPSRPGSEPGQRPTAPGGRFSAARGRAAALAGTRRAGGRGQSASADRGSPRELLETNHPLADDPLSEITVDAEDGVITISITHPLDEKACDAKQRVKVVWVADVRTLDLDRARPSRISGVYLPFRPDVVRVLETAKDASETLITRARARHGWGQAAAEEASKRFVERHGDALRLSHISRHLLRRRPLILDRRPARVVRLPCAWRPYGRVHLADPRVPGKPDPFVSQRARRSRVASSHGRKTKLPGHPGSCICRSASDTGQPFFACMS